MGSLQRGYPERRQLAYDGILTSNSGIKYQLADYTALNAATLKTTNSPITLEFVSAQQAEELYLLSISAMVLPN